MTATTTADYYALLGVDPGATTAQIKSAYRKLAKHYHPDINDSSDAAEKFREITEAYDTLTDPDRRRRYDRLHGTSRTTFTDDDQSRYTRPGSRVRERQQIPSRQPDPEGAGRYLAGDPPLAPGNPPGRHHHRQRHRRQAPPLGTPRPRPVERQRPAVRRGHDQRRRTAPHRR